MPLRFVIDMNLSPDWVPVLTLADYPAVHWVDIGDPAAKDWQIVDWCRANQHVAFTHDLDFGTLLALTHARGPSVVLLRAQDVMPDHMARYALPALRQHATFLEAGALLVVDEVKARVRILPL